MICKPYKPYSELQSLLVLIRVGVVLFRLNVCGLYIMTVMTLFIRYNRAAGAEEELACNTLFSEQI